MENTTDKRSKSSKAGDDRETFASLSKIAGRDKAAPMWIRDDGAICFGNECVTMRQAGKADIVFEVDPSKCPDDVREGILGFLVKNVASQGTMRFELKPKVED